MKSEKEDEGEVEEKNRWEQMNVMHWGHLSLGHRSVGRLRLSKG